MQGETNAAIAEETAAETEQEPRDTELINTRFSETEQVILSRRSVRVFSDLPAIRVTNANDDRHLDNQPALDLRHLGEHG
jgi:hypothetical protein